MRELLKNNSRLLCLSKYSLRIFFLEQSCQQENILFHVREKAKPLMALRRWFSFFFFICLQLASVEIGKCFLCCSCSYWMKRWRRRSRELLHDRCVLGRNAPYLRPHRIHPAVCAIDPSIEPLCWRPHSFCLAERGESPRKPRCCVRCQSDA